MAAMTARTGEWRLEVVKRNDIPPLRGAAETLDRRTNLGLDQSLPPAGPRFRATCPNRRRLRLSRDDLAHVASPHRNPFSVDSDFPERLLGAGPDFGARPL
jgi:hypothetical protein